MSRSPAHICRTKVWYPSEDRAAKEKDRLIASGATGDLRAFKCGACDGWHVGNWTPRAAFYNAGAYRPKARKTTEVCEVPTMILSPSRAVLTSRAAAWRRHFAWCPVRLGRYGQVRWLEWVERRELVLDRCAFTFYRRARR